MTTPLRERQLGARSECSLIHPNVVAAGGGASQKGQLGSSREGLCDELTECSVFAPVLFLDRLTNTDP
jgi:hypothetical protein